MNGLLRRLLSVNINVLLLVTHIAIARADGALPTARTSQAAPPQATRSDSGYFSDGHDLRDVEPVSKRAGDGARLPERKRAFCSRTFDDIVDELLTPFSNAHIYFGNPNGWFNTGLCWYHSRFQRAMSYLAHFRPGLPKPSKARASKIIAGLSAMDHVVEIPGYESIKDFTREHQNEITKLLNFWSVEAVVNGDAAERLGDRAKPSAAELRGKFDALYERMLKQRDIIFLRTHHELHHIFAAHDWLLLDIQPLRPASDDLYAWDWERYSAGSRVEARARWRAKNNFNPLENLTPQGYVIKVIDPDLPSLVLSYVFSFERGTLCAGGNRKECKNAINFYPQFDEELVQMKRAIREYCAQ